MLPSLIFSPAILENFLTFKKLRINLLLFSNFVVVISIMFNHSIYYLNFDKRYFNFVRWSIARAFLLICMALCIHKVDTTWAKLSKKVRQNVLFSSFFWTGCGLTCLHQAKLTFQQRKMVLDKNISKSF